MVSFSRKIYEHFRSKHIEYEFWNNLCGRRKVWSSLICLAGGGVGPTLELPGRRERPEALASDNFRARSAEALWPPTPWIAESDWLRWYDTGAGETPTPDELPQSFSDGRRERCWLTDFLRTGGPWKSLKFFQVFQVK